VDSFRKGQVFVGGIPSISKFDIEIPYEDIKYPFTVKLVGPDMYRFSINGQDIDVEITESAEGALLASFGDEMHRIIGRVEPLGLRLVLDGVTTLMPDIIDPSELRTDVTGKIVRYLQPNGANVKKGEGYVEVEAMKMIMTQTSTEDGRITHTLSPGTVIAAGDLLATLDVADPSRVKQIETFSGELDITGDASSVDAKDALVNTLAGFDNDPDAVAQKALADAVDVDASMDLITDTLEEFVRVESLFDGKVPDEAVRDLIKSHADNEEEAISIIRAHQQLDSRLKLLLAMQRQAESLRERFDIDQFPEKLIGSLEKIQSLKSKEYGDLKNAAAAIISDSKAPPFDDRVDELRSQLLGEPAQLSELANSQALSAGVDMLTYLFTDPEPAVRAKALEVYIRRIYRAYRLLDVSVDDDGKTASWSFQHMDVPSTSSTERHGILSVIPSLNELDKELPDILTSFGAKLPKTSAGQPVHEVFIVCQGCDKDIDVESVQERIQAEERMLQKLGVAKVNVVVPVAKQNPAYFTFPQYNEFKEDVSRRGMRPTSHHILELERLDANFELEHLHSIGRELVQVFLGTEKTDKPARGGPPQVVFVRGVSSSPGIITLEGAERALLLGLDELERAQANSKVSGKSSSKIFLHSLPPLKDADPLKLAADFKDIVAQLKSKYATRLLKLRVDQVEILARLAATDEAGEPMVQPIRFVASSMDGEWLKATTFIDYPDPATGITSESCILGEGDDDVCLLDPYAPSSVIQSKRAIARNVGSTYVYDFLSLLEVGLVQQWNSYIKSMKDPHQRKVSPLQMPADIFKSTELIEGADGELIPGSRPIGTNKVGMLAWHVTMKTPEYPEGRDVVVIANDVTVKSGSFSVAEDDVYYKASEYARKLKIPRVYIACNAGARIGLYDDLKSKIKLKFYDDSNPSKGFEYLYLTDEDHDALPEGAVNAHKVPEGWAIDDVIGTIHGIGVENLQGSGKIAGETSRAYDETFTLSYVTGRSVGIGAYLVRLGQRIIQKTTGPIILTGFSALNKLLGREVYNSQDQLGGPQIMIPNGVSHLQVEDDQAGVDAILEWLSFVPKTVGDLPACRDCIEPPNRSVMWRPTRTPYDPRLLFTGTRSHPGFFDKGSFKEYLGGWGKSVVVGRGRLGGIPMGGIAVETRQTQQIIPADPADPESSESVLNQAGKVWYPDSAFKTAQSIRDFDKEGLPVMIFANWRGFSGGSRDMAMEVLKFGSMIVDALRECTVPVYIYIPPHGELRGGSWVVLDPTINPDKMEMYADPDSRGGILEPSGIAEIKFRANDQLAVMHRNDPQLQTLDLELEMTDDIDAGAIDLLKEQIKAREAVLKPIYLQAATEFCDLHDKTGRMEAKKVIRRAVPWERSREFFYYRAKRRMLQDDNIKRLQEEAFVSSSDALEILVNMVDKETWDDDLAMIDFYTNEKSAILRKVKSIRDDNLKAQMAAIQEQLDRDD
jgi:acetyl-CoA carboxylase/biotin carboxylase 1